MNRLERLVNLLAALIETERPLTRDDIRNRVPGYATDDIAYRRAFERDKETLRSMGIPVVTEPLDPDYPDHGEGYRVPRDQYEMSDPGLSRDELAALALAASAIKLESQSATAALWKLGGRVETPAASVDVQLPDSEELAVVFNARRERRTLTFTYKGKTRRLDPYRLTFRTGHWYVNGFDHGHDDVRTYRLDRMEGAITAGEQAAFEAPAPARQPWLPPWQMGDQAPVTAHLLVDADQATLAQAQAPTAEVVDRRPDGSTVLAFTVSNEEAFRSFVVGFLHHAEVLSPPEMRANFVTYLESLVSR